MPDPRLFLPVQLICSWLNYEMDVIHPRERLVTEPTPSVQQVVFPGAVVPCMRSVWVVGNPVRGPAAVVYWRGDRHICLTCSAGKGCQHVRQLIGSLGTDQPAEELDAHADDIELLLQQYLDMETGKLRIKSVSQVRNG